MDNVRMKKSAGAFDTVAKIVGGIFGVFGVICVIFAILVVVFGNQMFAEGSLTLDLDFVKVHLSDEYQAVTGMVKLYALTGLAVGAVICLMVSYICRLIRRILAQMKAGRPFDSDVPAVIRKTAFAALICGGTAQALGMVERFIITKAYPMDAVFAADAVSKLEYAVTMDFGFVAVFCGLMLLSYIFAYGQALQRESDETL